MLYNSKNSECHGERASRSAGVGQNAGTVAGAGPEQAKFTKDICCAPIRLESSCARQILQDSGNASDCPESGVQLEAGALADAADAATLSWSESQGTRGVTHQDRATSEPCGSLNWQTSTGETVRRPGHVTSESTTNIKFAHKQPVPGHTSHMPLIDYQRMKPKFAHQGTSQKRWPISCAAQETPVCCLVVRPIEASCCPGQAQLSVSQQRDCGGNGGQLPEDETRDMDEPEEPLDYKPILAKILNEKKLALIGKPEVITFLNSGRPASGLPPSVQKEAHM